MKKLKLFMENFLIYGLGGMLSKLIPLVMLPIITRIMPDASYVGISDLSNTIVQFGSAIAIFGMYDAMYRMFFEREDEDFKKNICSTTFIFSGLMSILVCIIMIFARDIIARYFFGDIKYSNLVFIASFTTLISATNQIVSAPTRMQNKSKIFLVTNTLSSILSYAIAMVLILTRHYVIAFPIAALIAGIIIECAFWMQNNNWFQFQRFDKGLLKQLLVIAIPLIPNFLIYWVFNSSDKLMITNIIGVGAAGVYSVGSKLGHISQLIYTAFAGGWQYFAFSTMKENDQIRSNSKIFEYLGVISFSTTVFICAWSNLIYRILFVGDYVAGYVIAPYLFLAPLLQMLYQVACNQFIVVKKTWPSMIILSMGAVINVIINFAMIPRIGIEGAAIATLIGYIVSDVIGVIILCRMKLMIISVRFTFSVGLMTLYFLVWRLLLSQNTVIATLSAFFVLTVFGFLYRKELIGLFKLLKKEKV